MTKLSDTQAIILSAAAQGPDGNLLPLPGSLRGTENCGGTKQAELVAMLRRAEGATVAGPGAATARQPHTVRGAYGGALKKRLGLMIALEKVAKRGRVYRIAD